MYSYWRKQSSVYDAAFYMILYIGGLQNISEEIYEAAKIDGASRLQSVLHITVPLG